MTARVSILASDLAALERIAAKGYRVIVEGQGVRRVVEPVAPRPDDVQASGLTCDDILRQMGSD